MSYWKKRGIFLGTSSLATAGLALFLIAPGAEQPAPEDAIFSKSESMLSRLSPFSSPASSEIRTEEVLVGRAEPAQGMDFATPAPPAPVVMQKSTRAAMALVAPAAPTAPDMIVRQGQGDTFEPVQANGVKVASQEPVSTFSIDVDTASWSTIRSYIKRGQVPPADAVRIEEMVNYFTYDYAAPKPGDAPFSTSVATFRTPWNADTQLVHIGLQGMMPDVDERPPLDLVFLIDTSGSMRSADKIGLLKQSLKLMLPKLRPEDRVGIVTYAGSAGVALELTSAAEREEISSTLDSLGAGGSTAGAAGLRTAYGLLKASENEDRIGRVILATDGDFNVGMSSTDDMKDFIAEKRESGAYLSVLGFGHGNYNDHLMQTLAQNGNGQAAYIDTLLEARKVLNDQLVGALFPIANDVKIQVEFNPAAVAEYRLIGYETRALAREDFNNDKVDAGEIGAGHSVTALYEVTPVGSPAILNDPLRYAGEKPRVEADAAELGFVKLRYKVPGEDRSQLLSTPIENRTVEPDADQRFVAAIAGFGQILKDDSYLGDWGIDGVLDLMISDDRADVWGYRSEALMIARLYESLVAQ